MTIEIDTKYSVVVGKLTFRMTCMSVPEQYDVYKGKHQVGYVRARHGHFRVDCPDCGNDTVLHLDLPNEYQGVLDDAEFAEFGNWVRFEKSSDWNWRTPGRLARLQQAADAINRWVKRNPRP